MTIIEGVSNSGKSTCLVDIIKNKKKSMFFMLDIDEPLINTLKSNDIQYQIIKNCFLMDIKYRILEKGGLLSNTLDYVVIDSLNFISDKKGYTEKIKYLLDVEKDFKLKIITSINVLNRLDKISHEINNISDINVIKLKRKQ